MEPFRPLIAESAVLNAINLRAWLPTKDFVRAGKQWRSRLEVAVAFSRRTKRGMDTLVTHPIFGYQVSYRRLLEVQARLLAKVLEGELG